MGRKQKRIFGTLAAATSCVVIAFFLVRLYDVPWVGEQEIIPLDKAMTIVLKSDKPSFGLILRVEGHLNGAARINVPQLNAHFSLPEDFNKECGADSEPGPYAVQYSPVDTPTGVVKLKWFFIYCES